MSVRRPRSRSTQIDRTTVRGKISSEQSSGTRCIAAATARLPQARRTSCSVASLDLDPDQNMQLTHFGVLSRATSATRKRCLRSSRCQASSSNAAHRSFLSKSAVRGKVESPWQQVPCRTNISAIGELPEARCNFASIRQLQRLVLLDLVARRISVACCDELIRLRDCFVEAVPRMTLQDT